MDRRSFLHATAAVAATAGASLAAQTRPVVAPAGAGTFPPIDERSVWLIGDGAPPEPVAYAAQLQTLVKARGAVRDTYLAQGAVARLEAHCARMLGKEDAAFFPTGTMANNVAIRVLCGDRRRVLVQQASHLYRDEGDTAARLAGLTLVPLAAGRATPTAEEVGNAFDEARNGPYPVPVGAISIESPVRRADGELVPLDTVTAIAAQARTHRAGMHLDAARLLLAPPTLDLEAYVAPFDTVYVSLYKYLGAPFGAILAGSKARLAPARELRHVYGGLIYQGWEAALVALDSLETWPDRNARAHAAASRLVTTLEASGRVRRRPAPHASNIHWLEMAPELAAAAFDRGRAAGVRIGRWSDGAIPFFVNETINRRPLNELARLFLG